MAKFIMLERPAHNDPYLVNLELVTHLSAASGGESTRIHFGPDFNVLVAGRIENVAEVLINA